MKIKIKDIKIKKLLNESTYSDIIKKTQKGDILIIKTKNNTYKAEVVYNYSNRIIFKYNENYFLITDTSLQNGELETIRLILDNKGNVKNKIKGPTVNGVTDVIIYRNGKPLDKLKSNKKSKKLKKLKKFYEERYDDLKSVINSIKEDELLVITSGKLITKGSDKGKLAKNTITEIYVSILKRSKKGILKGKIIDLKGNTKNYGNIKNKIIYFNDKSLFIGNEGISLTFLIKEPNIEKIKINNVFSIDNKGININTLDDEENDGDKINYLKLFKDNPKLISLFYKQPSILGRILGKTGEFDKGFYTQFLNQLSKYEKNNNIKNGQKIIFRYYGDIINITKDLKFENGEKYVGKYDDNKIIVKSSNRKDRLEFNILGKKDNKYIVNVVYKTIKDNKPKEKEIGKRIIDIVGNN